MQKSRLDELFNAAEEVKPACRQAWLDQVCGDDIELRHALVRLLAADAHADGLLDSGAELISNVLADDADKPQAFGVWRVIRALGVGGMGEVWLAERDDAGFVQRAALKQVAYPTPGLLQRFARERQILARLEHPGIARLIDGGVDENGCPYLAMEYVEGRRIGAWVREQTLDVRTTVELLIKVCDAVQFAHRNLVVHSDIKPSNILVDGDGKPRLLDFGIARVLSDECDNGTHTATRLMTPDYAAPEWLRGGTPTTAVDVYALGVLGYELLSGHKPYRLERGGNTAQQLADTTVPPPSAAMAPNLSEQGGRKRAIRGDLDRVVMTAMAAEPTRRYATVEALSSDLRNWLDGLAVLARGDGAWYRLRKFVGRNRVAAATAAAAVLVLVAATVFSLYQAHTARQQAERAEAVRQFLADTFAHINPASHRGQAVSLRDLLKASEQQLPEATDVPISVRADLTTLIGTFYWNLADNVGAERVLQSVVVMASHGDIDANVEARALLALAQAQFDRGATADAYDHASKAHALALATAGRGSELEDRADHLLAKMSIAHEGAERAEPRIRALLAADRVRHGRSSQVVMEDLITLGQALINQSRYTEAQDTLTEAVGIARQLDATHRPRLGLSLVLLGNTRLQRGDYASARQTLTECLAVVSQLWGQDNVRSSIVRGQLLDVAIREGQFSEALPAIVKLLVDAERLKQARPDHYAETLELLGDAQLGLGQFTKAEVAFRQALTQWQVASEGHDSPGTAGALFKLGTALRWQGRLDEAEASFRSAVAIDHKVMPSTAQWLARDLAALGDVLRLHENMQQALRQSHAAIAVFNNNHDRDTPVAVQVFARHAEILLDAGDLAHAERTARDAQAMAQRVLPAENWQRAAPLQVLARVELAAGRAEQAEIATRSALMLLRPRLPEKDPRILELKATLLGALDLQGKSEQAAPLRSKLTTIFTQSNSPYLALLAKRLDKE